MKQWYIVIDVATCHDCNSCFMSKYACGMAPNTAQVEVEKWDGGKYEIY